MSDAIHVYPLNDLKEHVVSGPEGQAGKCHCNPRIEWEGFSKIVVHNSYDGRELLEKKAEKVQ